MRMYLKTFLLFVAVFLLDNSASKAETLSYWRFENGKELFDSSGNNRNLDLLRDAVVSGGGIIDPVPFTCEFNSHKLDMNGTGLGPRYYPYTNDDIMIASTLTIEAFFNTSNNFLMNQPVIAYDPGSDVTSKFRVLLTMDSLNFAIWDLNGIKLNIRLDWVINSNVNYYVACRYNPSTGTSDVVLVDLDNYFKISASNSFGEARDLAVPGSTAYPIEIGTIGAYDGIWGRLTGSVDEIRISNKFLSDSSLLVNVTGIPNRPLAYWRFENGNELVDNSYNYRNLDSLRDSVISLSGIVDPIPLSSQSNCQKIEMSGSDLGPRYYPYPGDTAFSLIDTLTVEVLFNTNRTDVIYQPLVCYEHGDNSKAKFRILINNSDIYFSVWDYNDTPLKVEISDIVHADTNYYVVCRYDASAGDSTIKLVNMDEKFYISASNSFGRAMELADLDLDCPLELGNVGSYTALWGYFDGFIDEIKISDEIIPDAHLMVDVLEYSIQPLGYWRFENGTELFDSSCNGRTLNSLGDVLTSVSGIIDPIPLTGQSNGQKIEFTGSIGPNLKPDDELMAINTFTVEAFFNPGDTTGYRPIVCYEPGNGSPAKFRLMNHENSIYFSIWDSNSIQNSITAVLREVITAGTNYYVSAQYDEQTGGAKLKLKNMDNGFEYIKNAGFGGPRELGVPASSGLLNIGSNPLGCFDGYIDEIKISRILVQNTDFLYNFCYKLGNRLMTDLNNDCYIDISDLKNMCDQWLNCVNPQDINCVHPWK